MKKFIPLVLVTSLVGAVAMAQEYPTRPVRIVVPNAPGSSIDIMTRTLSARMGDALGQAIVVENRDGAAGLIGMEQGKTARPDGYNLTSAANGAMLISPLLRKDPPYDPLNDFSCISLFALMPNVLVVTSDLPIHNVRELIDYTRANPGKVNMSSAGVGSQSHLSGALLLSMGGFESVHVPHKGGGPSVNAVVAGQTQWTITPAPAVVALVKSGRLRALGQSLPRRTTLMPDLPPVSDTVPGYDFNGWVGLVAPKGTPRPIVDRLNAAIAKTLSVPEVKETFSNQGAETVIGTPEDFQKFLVREYATTARVMKLVQLQQD
jgi:tripartite-type tricarboxylate transporter receptor subunit TctC